MVTEPGKLISKTADVVGRLPKRRLQLLISAGIILMGVLFVIALVKLRKPPQRVEPEILAPLVKIELLKARDIQMVVVGHGSVIPKVEVEIVPQVSGKIIWINPQFKAGGFIDAKETLLEIDPRDYELEFQQAQAGVAEAQVRLDIEKAEAQVAREEWQQLHPDTEPSSALVLREPQIRQAQARLASAKATLAKTRLFLERTKLSLPVDVRIKSETVGLGQYVMTGKSLGYAYGIDAVEIELPLEDERLAWFEIPDSTSAGKVITAEVKANFAGATHSWVGYVKRTTAEVDKKSRLISVVIEVQDPFDISGNKVALLPGMYVEVSIKGKVLKNAFAVPREAIHNRNEVWIVNNERLHIQPVEIIRNDKDFAYVVSGLDDNAAIVVSSLDVVTNGMLVRTKQPVKSF